ncbi:MAG: amidohydrolase family protein [Pseudomonadota bacterium]
MTERRGSILTPDGWRKGSVTFDARIDRIEGETTDAPSAPYILPGFIDLHVHGGGGADMMDGADAIRRAASLHAQHGTTALLATSVTAPDGETERFLEAVASLASLDEPGRARVLGAHLEGPFINPEKLGAQPPFAQPANLTLAKAWLALAPVRVMTYAPEEDPDDALRDFLLAEGVRLQIGHALCDYARAARCIEAGCGVTHLFNAMSGVSHRGNGIAGAALATAEFAEIVPDLIHVEAGAILAARRAMPNLYGVTDATAGAGAPDGDYPLGSLTATKADGAMRLPDGTLAGSALTMDQALRNFVAIGLPLAEAAARLSTIPADWLGETDIGRIAPNAKADLVIMDDDLNVADVLIAGETV